MNVTAILVLLPLLQLDIYIYVDMKTKKMAFPKFHIPHCHLMQGLKEAFCYKAGIERRSCANSIGVNLQ